ncbi:immunity repressor [Mycobacterium phage MKC-IRE-01]
MCIAQRKNISLRNFIRVVSGYCAQKLAQGLGACNSCCMSISTDIGGVVPQWDLADRLAKSLRVADVSVQEMADHLELHRNTISAWMNGRGKTPKRAMLIAWAFKTGVPFEWLANGTVQPDSGPDGDGGSRLGESNPRPIHYQTTKTGGFGNLSDAPVIPLRQEGPNELAA